MFAAKNTAAPSGEAVYIESVFSTYLYTGDGSGFSVNNGIDLSGKGGMVWLKDRTSANIHELFDTVRGATYFLRSNGTDAQSQNSNTLSAFNNNGFSIGDAAAINTSTNKYASWTFRDQAKFFDVVTYTGNGSNRTIAHNLGSVPGCIMVKRTDTTAAWAVYHRSLANTEYLVLNTTAAKATGATYWNSTTPTSTEFSLGTSTDVNASGGTYVAYLFAHDAGGFGASGSDNVISCGSVLGGAEANLGFEPQWVLAKASGLAANWFVLDTMRGLTADTVGAAQVLRPNESTAESTNNRGYITSTGFVVKEVNNEPYIYIAIRRPMKTPTSGTSVFNPTIFTAASGASTNTTYSLPFFDMVMQPIRSPGGASTPPWVVDRLRGATRFITTSNTSAEATYTGFAFVNNDGFSMGSGSGELMADYRFRRAPGFFDVVCYTGNDVNGRDITHNLGVAPELIILRKRSSGNWYTYYGFGSTSANILQLETTDAASTTDYTGSFSKLGAAPTATVFRVTHPAFAETNISGTNYIAYLFASLTGVSKVGTYTGNGSSQTINCGFTAGARFVLIKRTDSTGNWVTFDTARGIVSGNDPALYLNSTAAEVTGIDAIDPDNSGFIVNQETTFNLNVNAATYIYLAIA
jgi:hypothetical protein